MGKTNRGKLLTLLNNPEPERLIKKIEEVNENEHYDLLHELFEHIVMSLNFR